VVPVRHDVLVGKRRSRRRRRDAVKARCWRRSTRRRIDGNRLAFAREGLLAPGAVRVVHQTAPYDHCNMTVLDDGHPATARFVEVLQAMSYDDPVVRPLLDLEGLTRWLPGRTSGYAALERAVTRDGSLAAWLATVGPR
jgi:ABC-type phosphate/phosphonate transport system substrate-binding protein